MKFKDGKRIDTWAIGVDGHQAVSVEVFLRRRDYGTRQFFTAACASPAFSVDADDINDLRKKMRDELKQRLAVTWRRMIRIEIESRDGFRGMRRSSWSAEAVMRMCAETIQISTRTDGKKIHRSSDTDYEHADWPKTGETNEGEMVALVDDTEANRAALERVEKMIQDATAELRTRFAPDAVVSTFAALFSATHVSLLGANVSTTTEPAKRGRRRG